MDLVSLLGSLVAVPSHEGADQVQRLLAGLLEELGFRVRLRYVALGRPLLIARRGEGGPTFLTHVDTVPPLDHPEPFRLRRRGAWLVGRGVVDAKGQIAALLSALGETRGACQVVLTPDEERRAEGVEMVEIEGSEALVLEPTDLRLVHHQAGFLEVLARVEGRAAHSSCPERADHPLERALAFWRDLQGVTFLQARHPLFPPPWCSLRELRLGEDDIAVVPHRCLLKAELALLPGVRLEEAEREVRRLAHRHGLRVEIPDAAPPLVVAPGRLSEALRRAWREVVGGDLPEGAMRSWTEAEELARKGVRAPLFGAGRLEEAHAGTERVRLEQLERLSAVLAHLIERWPATSGATSPSCPGAGSRPAGRDAGP